MSTSALKQRKYLKYETEKYNAKLTLPERYVPKRVCGIGQFGVVMECWDKEKKKRVAIKKIQNAFAIKEGEEDVGKKIVREVELLDICPPISFEDFDDLYLVFEFMDGTIKSIIHANKKLTETQAAYFLYEILNGLNYVHSAEIVHRDIKPANILVNNKLEVKLCDFGLARGLNLDKDPTMSTKYVATRWYRAPELLTFWDESNRALDVFSAGCIFAEMLGKPATRGFNGKREWNAAEKSHPYALFRGRTPKDQIECMTRIVGFPETKSIRASPSGYFYLARRRRELERAKKVRKKIGWEKIYPEASADARDLLDRMLEWDPKRRIGAKEAMAHRFFRDVREEEDELTCEKVFDFRTAQVSEAKKTYKKLVYEFCVEWNQKSYDFEKEAVVEDKSIFIPRQKSKKNKKK